MSEISIRKPSRRIQSNRPFTLAVDIDITDIPFEDRDDVRVRLVNKDLKLDNAKPLIGAQKKPDNNHIEHVFGVAALRTHTSCDATGQDQEFPIEAEILSTDGRVWAETTQTIKVLMI